MKLRWICSCVVVLVGFLLSMQANGQVNKKPQAIPKPKVEATPKPSPPLMVEKATTETGKFILLKSDGTWEYDTTPRPTATPTPTPAETKGTLRFKAAVITQAGNVIQAARADFYLLDEDLKVISATKIAEAQGRGDLSPYMLGQDFKLIQPHKVAKATTDFEGNGVFTDIPPKTYWVYTFLVQSASIMSCGVLKLTSSREITMLFLIKTTL